MVCVQAWCIDQLEKFSLHEQDTLFPTAHMDHQFHCSLRLSHQVKLPTSCPIVKLVAIQNTYACILIFLTKQSMWSPVLLTKTFLLYSSTCLANVCITSNRFIVMTILHCRCYALFAIQELHNQRYKRC